MNTIDPNELANVSGGLGFSEAVQSMHLGGPLTRPPLSSPPFVPSPTQPLDPHDPNQQPRPWESVTHANPNVIK